MTRVRALRRVQEITRRPPRLTRAYLAETYDGIGQYVKVTMSRGAVTSAFRARIAAGDFGGGRTFPPGTPVVIFSNRGNLEVLGLGNLPRSCRETFSREEVDQLGLSEVKGIPWQQAWWFDTSRTDVDGDRAIFNSISSVDSDMMNWIASAEPLRYPFEATVSVRITGDPWPPLSSPASPFVMSGVDVDYGTIYNNNDAAMNFGSHGLPKLLVDASFELLWSFFRNRWELYVYDSLAQPPIENFPNIGSEATLSRVDNLNGLEQTVKYRVTDPNNLDEAGKWGIYAKWWVPDLGETEPEDWQVWQRTSNLLADPPLDPNYQGRNAFYIDDFGVGGPPFTVVTAATTSWDNLLFNQCLIPGFEPSPRIQF